MLKLLENKKIIISYISIIILVFIIYICLGIFNLILKSNDKIQIKSVSTIGKQFIVSTKANIQKIEEVENENEEEKENCLENNKQETEIPKEYNGFTTVGMIEIPITGLNIPILSNVTVKGMEIAPCLLYKTGELNEIGNSLIVGHNYRNGTIFSNNNNLNIGDKIYITNLDGLKKEYTIYNKLITTPEETSYIKKDTDNKSEIILSSCTDDDVKRIVILAREE